MDVVEIDRHARNKIRAVSAVAGKLDVRIGRYRKRAAALDMDQRRELPVIEDRLFKVIGECELALRNEEDILDVTVVRAARPVVPAWVSGIREACPVIVALGIIDVQALRPGLIGGKAESGGQAVRESRDQSVVVGPAKVGDQSGVAVAAK